MNLQSGFDEEAPNNTKVLLLASIQNLTMNHDFVPELAWHGLIEKFAKLFKDSDDLEVWWRSIHLLAMVGQTGMLTDYIYWILDIWSLLDGMAVKRNQEINKQCFPHCFVYILKKKSSFYISLKFMTNFHTGIA